MGKRSKRASRISAAVYKEEVAKESSGLSKKVFFYVALALVFGAFTFSLFGNLQYPLLWNDEGETAMYAKRILQYGYPKIHDGKNIVWLSENADKSFGIDQKNDSPKVLVWGQYYYAAIGAFLADKVDDLYLKTGILRFPFALAGLAGLCIMALSVIGLFKQNINKALSFLILFFLFCLLSVSLPLHLRDVRHPPLAVFLSAGIFYVYFNYKFFNRIRYAAYYAVLTILLFCLYHVFHAVFFIFLATMGLCEIFLLFKQKNLKTFFKDTAPMTTVFIMSIYFFLSSQVVIAGAAARGKGYNSPWGVNIATLFRSLRIHEFIYPVLAARVTALAIFLHAKHKDLILEKNTIQKIQVSNFFTLFFLIYAFVISLFPAQALFERYYVVLQPVMTMMLLLDLFGTIEMLSRIFPASKATFFSGFYITALLFAMILNIGDKIDHLKGHMYEITHQYKGPLDYAIPFLKERYKHPEDLVIATNYEELCYMYYLDSKVIVGYVWNNIDEDLKMRPDVLIYRKRGKHVGEEPFIHFMSQDKYEKFSFPVLDYAANNLPDRINPWNIHHLYMTPVSDDPESCLDIFLRSDSIAR